MVTEQFPPNSKGKNILKPDSYRLSPTCMLQMNGLPGNLKSQTPLWQTISLTTHNHFLYRYYDMKKVGKHCSHKSDFPSRVKIKTFSDIEKLKFYLPNKKEKIQHQNKKESNKTQHDMEETVAAELWYRNNI